MYINYESETSFCRNTTAFYSPCLSCSSQWQACCHQSTGVTLAVLLWILACLAENEAANICKYFTVYMSKLYPVYMMKLALRALVVRSTSSRWALDELAIWSFEWCNIANIHEAARRALIVHSSSSRRTGSMSARRASFIV